MARLEAVRADALPIHLYSGNAEAGFGGQVGFTMPFMNK
jgi:hypothetical protein